MWCPSEKTSIPKELLGFAANIVAGKQFRSSGQSKVPTCRHSQRVIWPSKSMKKIELRACAVESGREARKFSRVDVSSQGVSLPKGMEENVHWDAGRILESLTPDSDAELSISLVSDATIRELNSRWRGKDSATDVLSFEQDGAAGEVLGDVVVSIETAQRAANEMKIDLRDELRLLLTHGVLHLLGFDHEQDDERSEVCLTRAPSFPSLSFQ